MFPNLNFPFISSLSLYSREGWSPTPTNHRDRLEEKNGHRESMMVKLIVLSKIIGPKFKDGYLKLLAEKRGDWLNVGIGFKGLIVTSHSIVWVWGDVFRWVTLEDLGIGFTHL